MIINIGDISININCSNSILNKGILSRYKDFILKQIDHENDFTLDIEWKFANHIHVVDNIVLEFNDNCVSLSNQFVLGKLDINNNVGSLQIKSKNPIDDIDYFLRICVSLKAFNSGGFLLHSAGIVRNDLAYLFFGPSGSGKTTIAKNSRNHKILNDDLILVMKKNKSWSAYGTPFWNPSQETPKNDNAKIRGIFYIIKNEEVRLDPLNKSKALGLLIASIPIINSNKDYIDQAISLVQGFLNEIPAFELRLTKGDSFWKVIDDYFGKFD